MKTKIAINCALSLFAIAGLAQNPPSMLQGGEVQVPQNTEPCLTELQRNQIHIKIQTNISQLRAAGTYQEPNEAGNHPLFIWPVSQASGHNYNEVWSTTNFVDHNPAVPNMISDYECGTRSYDTASGYNHKGFDIISWPFWWKQMDLNQAVNVAAADGQIIDKNDGSFDRNCSFNNDLPNYVAVQHDDGSQSWYLHMKDGALTSKNIGDSVTAGEFLGVIGSSGSSTVPHLHFEVFDTNGDLIDPSIGSCNTLNSDTWWASQKPYYTPAINAALTHTDFPNFEMCPNTEITNESNQFALGETVFYGIYLKDQRANSSAQLKIIRPNGTVLFDFPHAITDDIFLSYWMWSFEPDTEGQWIFEATYFGDTTTHVFNVGVLNIQENELANTSIYPNPAKDAFYIESTEPISKVALRDIMGRTVISQSSYEQPLERIALENIAEGLYFIALTGENNQQKTIRLIKN